MRGLRGICEGQQIESSLSESQQRLMNALIGYMWVNKIIAAATQWFRTDERLWIYPMSYAFQSAQRNSSHCNLKPAFAAEKLGAQAEYTACMQAIYLLACHIIVGSGNCTAAMAWRPVFFFCKRAMYYMENETALKNVTKIESSG